MSRAPSRRVGGAVGPARASRKGAGSCFRRLIGGADWSSVRGCATVMSPDPRQDLVKTASGASTSWDVIVIGGGATGLATAWDAVSRGLRVALLGAQRLCQSNLEPQHQARPRRRALLAEGRDRAGAGGPARAQAAPGERAGVRPSAALRSCRRRISWGATTTGSACYSTTCWRGRRGSSVPSCCRKPRPASACPGSVWTS